MPFSVQEYENRKMPSMRALAQGGYEVAGRPNPNGGMATFERGGGNTGLLQGGEAIMRNEQAAQVGRDARARDDAAQQQQKGFAPIRTVAADPNWDAFFGSLQNAGAKELSTGAARGWNDPSSRASVQSSPGFFDADKRMESAASMNALKALEGSDTNFYAGTTQDNRRTQVADQQAQAQRQQRQQYLKEQDKKAGYHISGYEGF